MSGEFEVSGTSAEALFTLKLHRGEGMCLLAMNWKEGTPPEDFVGFAIEYKEPDGIKFFALKNRLCFPGSDGGVNPNRLSTRLSPIQKFRWVHFPRNAELPGEFVYQVTPVFMNDAGELSYGEPQSAAIELRRETYPGQLNVTFTRGFVSSQAFVDFYGGDAAIPTLLPDKAEKGLTFMPTHPKAEEALAWMGFEARSAILEVLDQAIADETAEVRAVVYDLNEPGIVSRLEKLGTRLKILIDDEGAHGEATSAETAAAARLAVSAGADHVKRQHLGSLQHNKTVVVDGQVQAAVCGSTNHSWRGFFVQNNNADHSAGPERGQDLPAGVRGLLGERQQRRRLRQDRLRRLERSQIGRHRRPDRILAAVEEERGAEGRRRRHRDHRVQPLLLARLPLPDPGGDPERHQEDQGRRHRLLLRHFRSRGQGHQRPDGRGDRPAETRRQAHPGGARGPDGERP